MRETPDDARRKGQLRGQFAAKYGISEQWLRLISEGSLSDPEFVIAIREAAKQPHLWAVVAPAAQEALFIPTVKIKSLGGTLDDLLALLLNSIELLQHPANHYYASQHTALDHVNTSLDFHLENRRDADIARGRKNRASVVKAAKAKAAKALDTSAAHKWREEVQSRRVGMTKEAVYSLIGRREGLRPGSVKKSVLNLEKHLRQQK